MAILRVQLSLEVMDYSKVATIVLTLGAACAIVIGVSQMLEEDERRAKRKMIRMKYRSLIKQLNAETSKLEEKTSKLEKDMNSASKQDEKKKVSSYYFFSSSGSKNKNKWDNFKDDEEMEGVSKGENEGVVVPTLTITIRSLKKKTLACRELTKKLDQVTADMVADRERNDTLISIRKRLARRIAKLEQRCEDSLKQAQTLLIEKRQKEEEEKKTQQTVSSIQEIRKPLTEEQRAQLNRGGEKSGALSNWNKSAKTFEERDVTEHANDILRRYLKQTSAVVNGSTIRVSSIDSLKGNASMLVHKKNSYIFEYSFTLSWLSDSDTKGTLRFAEIDVLQLKEGDIEASGRSVDAGDHVIGLEHAKMLERAVCGSLGSFFEELKQGHKLEEEEEEDADNDN